MPRIGSAQPRAPRPPADQQPMRSGDFVPFLSRPTTPAEKKQLAAKAEQSIATELQKARAGGHPDILSLYAEEAGNLLVIRRALGGHPRGDAADTARLAGQVEALLNQVVDARIAGMKALAASPAGPEAIRQGEADAGSLKLDLQRVYRFGFEPRSVDIDALDHAIKKAVVDSLTTGRRGGWSPP